MSVRLYVGLGNPVKLLRNTRHNIGYGIIDAFLENPKLKQFIREVSPFDGLYHYDDGMSRCYLLKPYCSMNDSGEYVRMIVEHLNMDTNNVTVFYDEMDIEFGAYQKEKSLVCDVYEGHKGIASIVKSLDGYIFVNPIGIGKPEDGDIYNHVLGDFNCFEIPPLLNTIYRSVEYIKYCVGITVI